MGKSFTYKILENHLIEGALKEGEEIGIKIDQTLTQDSTGTMVYLQLEAMEVNKIKTDLSVAYIDHNTLQTGFENADDHAFIKSVAAKYGILFSKPGNGICHQLHLENYGKCGGTLLGSDSHTPTCGGLGMLSIGAGGLDVAVAMAKGMYHLKVPKIMNIRLKGKLQPWVSAKDVILYILQKLTVKGGIGKIIEYTGEGIKSLSVTDRATITNMGAELGATTSIFPSDEETKKYLIAQGRKKDWVEMLPDPDAKYDEEMEIDLSKLTPMVAKPHSPDNVESVKAVGPIKINQVAIGSCTNSSYTDLMKVAEILKGKKVHSNVSLCISPGSSKILSMLADNGALGEMIRAGARILEASCGPCIGMGQSPQTNGVSLRTFNRNFKERSGTASAQVYLVSPETAAVSAIMGYLTDGTSLGESPVIKVPDLFPKNDHYMIYPNEKEENDKVIMGPNIKPFPKNKGLAKDLLGKVILKTNDNITTDDIMPSNAKLLPYRSNIPYLSSYCFHSIDEGFREACQKHGGGFIVGGENYGQGSSREHAALVPLYLGIEVILAKSFARIHRANLINSGILPLEFVNKEDYEKIETMDELKFENIYEQLKNEGNMSVYHITKDQYIPVKFTGSQRDKEILMRGGYLNYTKETIGGDVK
ncbi:aconitate hydratase [Clostridiaceae bacterium 35-E11]